MSGLAAAKATAIEDFEAWQPRANCRGIDPNEFFPDGGVFAQRNVAAIHCVGCPVRMECLNYALIMEAPGAKPLMHRSGVWGGLADTDRKSLTTLLIQSAGDDFSDGLMDRLGAALEQFYERPRKAKRMVS